MLTRDAVWSFWLVGVWFALGCGGQPQNQPPRATSQEADPAAKPRPLQSTTNDRPPLAKPERIDAPHLPNPWRLHSKVISGGLPEGDAAFQELAELGIKTVISVDGAQPDVERAKRFGLRYVHMPHGYDGVPEQRAKELAKAVRDLPGPIYIHCHHGKHRSPAAATVACVGAGLLPATQAREILKLAGTSENYRGLYQSAESARRLDQELLDALKVEYPESVKLPPIADAMIAIEHAHDHLKAFAANRWRKLERQPDLDAAHEALLLREQYTELLRSDDVRAKSSEFRKLLQDSEDLAKRLESQLEAWKKSADPSAPPPDEVVQAFAAVSQACVTCHKAFRDIPLSEKPRH